MTSPATTLLIELEGLGVRVAVEQGQLVLQAPRGVLSPTLRERVALAKPELVALLQPVRPLARPLSFSLFYFASEAQAASTDCYRLVREGAQFADSHDFEAVWTPERHFHPLGGHFPNPAVTAAALAVETSRVAIRAGSVVLPLHDPLRVAEEWAVVDNLSRGRVGLAFASGWHADDFVFAPERYAGRKAHMLDALETVRALWRGDAAHRTGGAGNPVAVRVHPRPLQPELPVWLTAIGSLETFEAAGRIGANLLTCLLGQALDDLTHKIARYREVRAAHGHTGPGRVTLMVHAHLGDDADAVRERVRAPFGRYLMGTLDLLGGLAASMGATLDPRELAEADREALLAHAFSRYAETSALFGTPASVYPLIEQISAAGVDELGCLIDFGLAEDTVLNGLDALDALRRSCLPAAVASAGEPA